MFGCDHCIPRGLVAAPAKSEELVDGCFEASIDWIAHIGSAQDLLTDHHVPDHYGYFSENPIRLITANGERKQGKVKVPELNSRVNPYLVQSSPPVLSVGTRCIDEGFDFVWRGSKGEKPYMIRPDGKRIDLEVRDYVPYLCSKSRQSNVSLAATKSNGIEPTQRVKVLASSSKDVETPISEDEPFSPPDDGEYEDDEPDVVGGFFFDRTIMMMTTGLVPDISGGPGADAPDVEPRIEADREVLPAEEEPPEQDYPRDPEMERRRERGKAALKAEAKSKRHMLTHIPKNPYCEVCNKANIV